MMYLLELFSGGSCERQRPFAWDPGMNLMPVCRWRKCFPVYTRPDLNLHKYVVYFARDLA